MATKPKSETNKETAKNSETIKKSETIKNGDKIKVEYTGKFSDGNVFDSSKGREPLSFEVGSKQVIPGFENAIIGTRKMKNIFL